MKRIIAILVVCLVALRLCNDNTQARPTTQDEAKKVVMGWLKTSPQPLGTALGQHVTNVEIYTDDNGNPLYYIVYLQPNGFVIVSGDDLIEPIIGFTPEGIYDPSPSNPLGALVNNDLNGRIDMVRSGGPVRTKAVTDVTTEPQGKWNKFISLADAQEQDMGPLGITTIDDVRVSPIIQSRWNQTTCCTSPTLACYNYYTPGDGNNGQGGGGLSDNYYCGCVATALAQIMRYYQWPSTGVGTNSFSIKIRGAIYSRTTRGGNGAGGVYGWANMVYTPGCGATDTQRQAIGALCYDVGVGESNLIAGEYINYTSSETDAYTQSAKVGLISTFKYSNAVYGYNSGSNIGAGLIGMVNPNLDANRPVCFGIHGSGSTGHEVVCDGYGYNSGTMFHHLNMGWSGLSDAWYALPDINSWPTSYSSVYETIYNIYTHFNGEIFSGRVTDPCGNPISDVNVQQFVSPGPSPVFGCLTNNKGIYSFSYMSSNTNYGVYATKTGYSFPSSTVIRTGHSTDSNSISGNVWGVDIVCYGPDINTISPASGPPGTYMKIQGTHFGSSTGQVVFPGVGYYGDILQWSDTVILCRVPWGTSSGTVKVQTSAGVIDAGAYFEVTDPTIIYVDTNHTPNIENGTIDFPFSTIQRGMDAATYQDNVIVKPGIYYENIVFGEQNFTLTSTDPNDPCIVASTVIDGNENGVVVVTLNNNCSTLTGFTITNGNDSGVGFGGGVYCSGQCGDAAPTISHCIITRNSAVVSGGGICSSDSNLTIDHCIITGNSPSGLSILSDSAGYFPKIVNCIITGNMASGIYLQGGTPTIRHCDIINNTADNGGGIYCNDTNVMISHSILWANTAVYYGPEIFVIISGNPNVTIKYSDVQGGLAGMSYPPSHTPHWDANDINADPIFVRDPNPGPDGSWNDVNDDFGDLHLQSGSPCIDAGDKNYIPETNETDMDGQPRVVGCRVDIGADEFVYIGDIEPDGDVDFNDFAVLANYWQETGCGKCSGAELTGDGIVDIKDLAAFAENWLKCLCKN